MFDFIHWKSRTCTGLIEQNKDKHRLPVQALKHGRIRPSPVTTSYNGCDI